MDVDVAEAERAAAEEGVRGRPPIATSPHLILTSSGYHSKTQAAHQLAAETLLSIGPNSRSVASVSTIDRPPSTASTSRVTEDVASKSLDARGLKRKSIEDTVVQKARANAMDSPKRRALSPARQRDMDGTSLPARGYRGPRPRPYSFYGSDEEYEFAQLSMEEQRHRRLLDWHHMRAEQKKDEEEMRARDHVDLERERMRDAARERDRRLGTTPTNGANTVAQTDAANGTRTDSRTSSMIGSAYVGGAAIGARPSPYRYGGSMFDNDRYGFGRQVDRTKEGTASTSSHLSSNRPASWINPLVASRSRPGSPTGSPAQVKASPTMNALTRKELQDHRDSLLEGKKWLEERLSKTERLLSQLNDKLAEPVVPNTTSTGRPTSSHAPASASGTGTTKDDEVLRARQARERELINGRRTGYGGLGFGGGGSLLGSGYGSPYGGGLGLLRMSEWDSWSRDKHLRERERETREKEAERVRLENKDKVEREREREREREKVGSGSATAGGTGTSMSTATPGSAAATSTTTTTTAASPSVVDRKPLVPPLGSALGLGRRKEMGGSLYGHGGSWSMT